MAGTLLVSWQNEVEVLRVVDSIEYRKNGTTRISNLNGSLDYYQTNPGMAVTYRHA